MKLLIFIPARKGNKKTENKNLFKVNGVTLLEHTLSLAKNFKKKGKIFISTDHIKIINKFYKYTYGYRRPKHLTGTGVNLVDSILDALKWFESKKEVFEAILLLPPTSPVRNKDDLKKSMSLFSKKKIDSLVSAVHMREHPNLCIKLKNKNNWNYLYKKNYQLDFDKLEKKFLYLDGNFSYAKVSFLKKYKNFLVKNKTKFFTQERYVTIDVNEKQDIPIVKYLLKKN
jgi:N-acylneuraminate cytidylyltransferase/CMP-N,N'-diacetyllegionaminic acid synthase